MAAMMQYRRIRPESIPRALERVERYRLLNQPRVAESICRDILEVDPANQRALTGLVLALTDQFELIANAPVNDILVLVARLDSEYAQTYHAGIVWERHAKARIHRGYPGAEADAWNELQRAMMLFDRAQELSPPDDDDAVLHWNGCQRFIEQFGLAKKENG
jgi:hypothetical protein